MRYKVPTIFKIGSFGKEHYFMVEIVVDYLGKLVIIFLGELDGLLYALVIFVSLEFAPPFRLNTCPAILVQKELQKRLLFF